MRSVVIIQARMGSTRLPGKVMKELIDQTVLAHVVQRAKAIPGIDEVAVATTVKPDDAVIAEEAKRLDVPVYRGSEQDVLSRYYEAAAQLKADVVMRVTSDCPLLDPHVSGAVLRKFLDTPGIDYASNTLDRRFPRGLDTEVFSFAALAQAFQEAKQAHEREHVTPFLYENRQRFVCGGVVNEQDHSNYRWTLDTAEDWQLIQVIYRHLYQSGGIFGWQEALALMEAHPEYVKINAHIEQKSK
ncbi:cytidylyltransferase domain-containing protein [Brevibacillus fulvus]|uniref:Spore coat polysaccharide biosynthesis protein SpsF n=1 Tax=Brevibacillus fulvus TaxID=1125967 RepID=A0A939BW69_9BACL|nr:glycosyltransferase family protein [Brevibacillus fulvus]MBM7591496.1 spore coat polysaccharide biosynthesis protein SpsF [Brevibacillus fulvus]